MRRRIWIWMIGCAIAATLALVGCGGTGEDERLDAGQDSTPSGALDTTSTLDTFDAPDWSSTPSDAGDSESVDAESPDDGLTAGDGIATADGSTADDAVPSGDSTPSDPPQQYTPCSVGTCWSSLSFSAACGPATLDENYSSGKYNVHVFSVFAKADVDVEVTLKRTAGVWNPALIVQDAQGLTLGDGELGVLSAAIVVEVLESGRDSDLARVKLRATSDVTLKILLTSWQAIDSGFVDPLPKEATYTFGLVKDCELPTGQLLSPPNFDPQDVVGGYSLLPPSDPPGLYTKKKDLCSRGTKLLIDVLYTVATNWKQLYPELAPISILDLNECDGADHETHNDGTHVDIVVECATDVSCADIQPAIDLAKLFVDTGQTCGIIFNDDAVQAVVNPYFESQFDYEPWYGTYMRTYVGHEGHFHVRVKKPNGACN
ncbi:MAG: hypothetical protein KC609_16690 [Myxococcales bacterium]|nr:hypothetical protein [Myxococcales bacterium]